MHRRRVDLGGQEVEQHAHGKGQWNRLVVLEQGLEGVVELLGGSDRNLLERRRQGDPVLLHPGHEGPRHGTEVLVRVGHEEVAGVDELTPWATE